MDITVEDVIYALDKYVDLLESDTKRWQELRRKTAPEFSAEIGVIDGFIDQRNAEIERVERIKKAMEGAQSFIMLPVGMDLTKS